MRVLIHLLRGLAALVLGTVNFLCRALLLGWGAGAIWWSPLPWSGLRALLAVGFVVAGSWMLWRLRPARRGFLAFALLLAAVAGAWLTIQPTHDRDWAPDVAVLPHAEIQGDRVTIRGMRDFDYRSADDFTPRYGTREVLLSHLVSLDLFVCYSGQPGPIAHTFVSFNFDNAAPVCISIEARRRRGDHYRPVASIFKQFELIYIPGEERDIVRLRTNYRKESVHLYRIRIAPGKLRELFLHYLDRMNRIERQPEFYNLLSNNCTLNIHQHLAETRGPAPWDWAMLLNGWTARLAYQRGAVDTSLPYEELERRCRVNERAMATDADPDFSKRIRENLPVPAGF